MRLALLIVPLLLAACDGKQADSGGMKAPPAVSGGRAKDPVCGMMVDKATTIKTTYESTNYSFCAEECRKKFQDDPKKHAVCCTCAKTAKKCDCGHCGAKGDTCDCHA